MPWIVPFIPLLAAGASAGTSIGLDLSQGGGPSAQQEQTLINQQNQSAQQKAEQQAFRTFAPNTQAQTSGSLDAGSMSEMIAAATGSPADINLAQQTIFGTQPGLSTGG
jgi:hypothetical protein